jgi:ribose transport system permease protein
MNDEPTDLPATSPLNASATRRFRLSARAPGMTDVLGMLAVLAVLIVLFGLLSRHFLTLRSLQSIVNQVPDLMVIAAGITLVLIAGGIDLSVGSVLALSGVVLGIAIADWGWSLVPAIVICLASGAACGLANGLVSALWSIPSFIVTLGMLEVARGTAYLATDSQTKYIGPRIEGLARPLAGIGVSPAFLVAIVVVLIAQIFLSRTVWGRYIVAVGANEQAARFSGIATRRIKLTTFVLSGLMAALGAIFQVARLSSADPNGGIGMELAAIAAVVIGGTSLMGGQGSVFRSFLGVLIIAVLQTGLAQVGATEPTKRLITGGVIVLAVVADVHRRKWTNVLSRSWRRLVAFRETTRH